jgi:MYXO-CTERM domain-containing protein
MQVNVRALAAALSVAALTTVATAAPDIGGTPIHTEDDFFTGGPWGLFVSSYVYDDASELPEGFSLNAGELLFIYLLDGDEDNATVSVDTFSVGNPNELPITSVGFATVITPPGFDADDREDPFLFGYSGPARATVYTYAGDFSDPFSTLDPEEWSLVWYKAEADNWGLGPATASGAGIGDTQMVPVPLPGPGALALLGIAGLAVAQRRRRLSA